MDTLKRLWPQLRPSPSASLTEANLPSQAGRVVLVTGATAGVGYELSRILYNAGARVYMAARSPTKADDAIARIRSAHPAPKVAGGALTFLHLDYADLATVKPCAQEFLSKEPHLHVLFNNAGMASAPPEERSSAGLELHMQVNCVGGFLLTKLLSPALEAAAEDAPAAAVRVVFSSSMLVDAKAPDDGVPPEELDNPSLDGDRNYAISKAGNWFLAAQFAQHLGPAGVVVLTQNPGNLRTAIFDKVPKAIVWASYPVLFKSLDGAHTSLWSGFSSGVTLADGGRYVVPWGKWHPNHRPEQLLALKDKSEGGKGCARHLFEWCDVKTKAFQ
jgi:NAD(P)-dependent dehydrogenase (short-subunit alcohol dehydrogenase family)